VRNSPTQNSKEPENKASQQSTTSEQRGTEEHPVVVKVIPTEKTAEERAVEEKDRTDKSSSDWWLVGMTGILALVGTGQGIVFAFQAIKLRDSVNITRQISSQQERDMHSSISEASRAAVAMERVATGIAASVENTRQLGEMQRDFWQRQMRAYLSVRFGGVVRQDSTKNYKFEIRVILANTGQTPAYNVFCLSRANVLPFPLPEGFSFETSEIPITSAGVLGPQQVFTTGSFVDRMLSGEEISEISKGSAKRLYLYGIVNYTDAFGVDRFTNFSQRVEWLSDGTFMGFNTRRYNDAT
jgi:hypothetical protein